MHESHMVASSPFCGCAEFDQGLRYRSDDSRKIFLAPGGVTSVGAIGVSLDALPKSVLLGSVRGIEAAWIRTCHSVSMRAWFPNQVWPQGHHLGGLEGSCVSRQSAWHMGL